MCNLTKLVKFASSGIGYWVCSVHFLKTDLCVMKYLLGKTNFALWKTLDKGSLCQETSSGDKCYGDLQTIIKYFN